MINTRPFDLDRPDATRHELLSTSTAAAAPLALVSAPQATFQVTTRDDVVDANDGVLSLREAITLANDTPGRDTITLGDDLRGGTIELTGGALVVSDDVRIDGDQSNGGPSGILIRASGATVDDFPSAFEVTAGVSARFEDMSFARFSASITGRDADLEVSRVDIRDMAVDVSSAPGYGIAVRGGTLSVEESVIGYSGRPAVPIGIQLSGGADVTVERSTIAGLTGESGYGIQGEGKVRVTDTTIADNGLTFGFGISIEGDLLIESSTFARNGTVDGIAGSAVRIDGSLVIVNSTIADTATGATYRPTRTGAVTVLDGSNASIVNSTITGSALGFTDGSPAARNTYGTGTGIYAAPTSVVEVRNSIIDDSVFGTITSNGANTFRDAAVTGAAGADHLGVTADAIFALTKEVPISAFGSGAAFTAGLLTDNGGPTQTIALRNSQLNLALDNANPADAPLLDQRGFPRDATPDIGAFELGPTTLPPLSERVPVPDSAINGVPRSALTLTGGRDAAISFVDEVAAFQNSLGVYLIGPEGEIVQPRWVFERIEHALADDSVSAGARPGGGPSTPGDTVLLSDLYDPWELQEGTEFGLFLVADGAARNPFVVFDGGTLDFRTGGGDAKVTDTAPRLVHIAETGAERLIQGDIMHTIDAGSPNPLSNTLNPPASPGFPVGGRGQALSGLLDGEFVIAFEDKPFSASDKDFNDALFAVDLLDSGYDVFAAAAGADVATAPAGAALETLLMPVDTV